MVLSKYRELSFMKRCESSFFIPMGVIGSGLGFAKGADFGIKMADKHRHGKIWRPVTGALLGGMGGGIIGLYWTESLAMIILFDLYQSLRYNSTTEKDKSL